MLSGVGKKFSRHGRLSGRSGGVRSPHRRRWCAVALAGIIALGVGCALRAAHTATGWKFAVFGTGVQANAATRSGSFESGSVMLEASGSGKMVPYGADGLAFYYTELDAAKDNFVLSANLVVDAWTMTNGEDDGFGLMVCDAVGANGDSTTFWNNSYMAAITKVEYDWNPMTQAVSNVGDHIVMRQGLAAREKIGSVQAYPEDQMQAAAAQSVTSCTLESSQGSKGPGTYNIIGNCAPITSVDGDRAPAGTVGPEELLTTVRLEICRDNTGYRLRYIEGDGTVHEKLFYDEQRRNLSAIDSEKIYLGFFVTRRARVTFEDLSLTVTDAAQDPEAEPRLPEAVDPDFRVTSSETANAEAYDLVFQTNYAGALTVKDERGMIIAEDVALAAGESAVFRCALHIGDNPFDLQFTPDTQADPSMVLTDTSSVLIRHHVSYQRIGDERGMIHTAPDSRDGNGTAESPISLAEAVKYAAPGQTIVLSEGVYELSEPLNIERGHDGTESARIGLISDPANRTRPVLDFGNRCAGIILSANDWYLCGFDCTGTASNEYGIHLTGSHNTLERLEIYRNGNTGLHISSLSLWDDTALWPSDNHVLNCTSYANSDDAYEDADGFACQFTAGPGNVFDGCIAHHNADDGWDFYAKVWLAPLGPVTLRNCIAYQNGYLENGMEAGNGNGFKLGGDSMPGGHVVENCLAFENKAAGFTSNSCPNVTIRDCTSIDNIGANFDLYTKNQVNTAYVLHNIGSFRTDKAPKTRDRVADRGTQIKEDSHNETVFCWDPDKKAAVNSVDECLFVEAAYASVEFQDGYSIIRDQDGHIVLQGDFLRDDDGDTVGVRIERNFHQAD